MVRRRNNNITNRTNERNKETSSHTRWSNSDTPACSKNSAMGLRTYQVVVTGSQHFLLSIVTRVAVFVCVVDNRTTTMRNLIKSLWTRHVASSLSLNNLCHVAGPCIIKTKSNNDNNLFLISRKMYG